MSLRKHITFTLNTSVVLFLPLSGAVLGVLKVSSKIWCMQLPSVTQQKCRLQKHYSVSLLTLFNTVATIWFYLCSKVAMTVKTSMFWINRGHKGSHDSANGVFQRRGLIRLYSVMLMLDEEPFGSFWECSFRHTYVQGHTLQLCLK